MSGIPPTFDPRNPPPQVPGGVPLLGQQRVQPTLHKTEFHACQAGFYALLGEDDICTGYRLQIVDPLERHEYIFDFGQEVLDEWSNDLSKFPRVGQKPEDTNGSN